MSERLHACIQYYFLFFSIMHVLGQCTQPRFVFSLAIVSADNFCAEQEGNSKAQNNRTRTLDTLLGLVRTYYSCFCITHVHSRCHVSTTVVCGKFRLCHAVDSFSGIQCSCHRYSAVKDTVRLLKGYTQFAFAVDSHGYSVLVHVRWILKDYSALVSINFSKKN